MTELPSINEPRALIVGAIYLLLCAAGLAAWFVLFLRLASRPRGWPAAAADRLRLRPVSPRASLWLTALIVLSFVGLTVFERLRVRWGGDAMAAPDVGRYLVVHSLLFHGLIVVFVAGWLFRSGRSAAEVFGVRPESFLRDVGAGVLWYLAAVPVVVVGATVFHLILRSLGYSVNPQEALIWLSGEYALPVRLYLYLLAALLAPLAEELYFRGMILPLFMRRMKPLTAVLFVAAAFALIHLHVPSFIALFIIALTLSAAYVSTGSIVAAITVHVLFNSLNLLLFLFVTDAI